VVLPPSNDKFDFKTTLVETNEPHSSDLNTKQ